MAVVGVVFSLAIPLAALAFKTLLVLLVGYFILRLVRPDLAENIKSKVGKS